MRYFPLTKRLFFLSIFLSSFSMAGECNEADTTYVDRLDSSFDYYSYGCLTWTWTSTNRWAGPIAASAFESIRSYAHRDRIGSICKRKIDEAFSKKPIDSELIYKAAILAAHYGFKNLSNYDIFPLIISMSHNSFDYVNIAILNDDRVIPYLKDNYTKLRQKKLSRANREGLISILNCLYHFDVQLSYDIANDFLKTETDSLLVSRLKLIINKKIAPPAREESVR